MGEVIDIYILFFPQFCCKTKTALGKKSLKKKERTFGGSPFLIGDEEVQIPKKGILGWLAATTQLTCPEHPFPSLLY